MTRMKLSILVLTLLLSSLAPLAMAQEAQPDSFVVVDGDTLFVTAVMEVAGDRVVSALPGVMRPVGVQDADDLSQQPLRSVADALANEPAVVTGQRQAYGVQSDLSIRGSTFEQVQLLLDGFDLGDPQTGHHLMNLPLAPHDIARLEVMPGHGSSFFGNGAFGGTVNVVPRRPTRGFSGDVGILGGPDGTWALRGSVNVPFNDGGRPDLAQRAPISDRGHGLRLSAERFRTDGHTVDGEWSGRDADLWSATARWLNAAPGRLDDVFLGFADRRFGAQNFYAPAMSFEHTRVLVGTARSRRQLGEVTLEPRLAVRTHRDVFTLFRDNPSAYENDHETVKVLGGIRGAVPLTGTWIIAGDLEGVYEDIDSQGVRSGVEGPALGRHVRRRGSAAMDLTRNLLPVSLQVGGRLDAWQGYEPRLGGTASAAWAPRPELSVHASAGTLYRLPTFTELYYEDPYNQGNPDLESESGWAWDAGVRRDDGRWLAAAVYFERHEKDLIDWSRAAGSNDVWQVGNIAEGRVRGVELQTGWRHGGGHLFKVGWQVLHREVDYAEGTQAKYDLLVPKHNLTGSGTAILPFDLTLTVRGRWIQRTGGPDDFREYAVWDARLRWQPGAFAVAVDATNLTDRRYAEIPGAVMPGRTVTLGVDMGF